MYGHLVEGLRHSGPIFGIQSRALDDPEHELGSLEAMAETYSRLVRDNSATGYCCLLGWSTGGVYAWSIASALQAKGGGVLQLILLDSYLPQDMRDSLPGLEAALRLVMSMTGPLGEVGEKMIESLGPEGIRVEVRRFYEQARDLPAEERFSEMSKIVKKHLGNIPSASAAAILKQFDLIVRHDSWLMEFKPSEFKGELVLVQSSEGLGYPADAWRAYARGPVFAERAAGNHFGMLAPPNAEALARKLNLRLRSLEANQV
jgi:thioesterase domain-containing protein